jgi:ADP-ribose pyrophosphatase
VSGAGADDDRDAPLEVPWRGKYIEVRKRGRWEFAGRTRSIGAAVILALDGAAGDRHVILIEQYRVPLGRRCLELPAGLVGDDHAGDTVAAAAARELAEETGYRADRIEVLGEFHSSPGMVSEGFSLVRATGLTRIGAGGGIAGEDIIVHRVPVNGVAGFVAAKRAEGLAIDVKLLLLLAADFLRPVT